MADRLHPGDMVEWRHSQEKSTGEGGRKVIRPTCIRTHNVAVSPVHPAYIVQSRKTGARVAHTPCGLRKV